MLRYFLTPPYVAVFSYNNFVNTNSIAHWTLSSLSASNKVPYKFANFSKLLENYVHFILGIYVCCSIVDKRSKRYRLNHKQCREKAEVSTGSTMCSRSFNRIVSWNRPAWPWPRAGAEHVRGAAKIKRQRDAKRERRINDQCQWRSRRMSVEKSESANCVVEIVWFAWERERERERALNPWWRELRINYLVVYIIVRYCD